jgi:hypothetical protein
METITTKMTPEEMQADWIATRNIIRFQESLNGETDDSKYRILSQLLVKEFAQLEARHRKCGSISLKCAIRNQQSQISQMSHLPRGYIH